MISKSFATLLVEGATALEKSSLSARLDAEVILAHILQCEKLQLVLKRNDPVSEEIQSRFTELLAKRVAGEPVAYITGTKEFFGRDFKVTKDTLIPRPETEHLVEEAIKFVSNISGPVSILDLGTGSGILISTVLLELESRNIQSSGVATDISAAALAVARENASRFGVDSKITFLEGSWWEPVHSLNKKFSIIVTNPPYIAEGDRRVSPETRYEPQAALYSGSDGLDAYRIIFSELPHFLAPGGLFLGEIGFDQAEIIRDLYPQIEIGFDIGGRCRFTKIFA